MQGQATPDSLGTQLPAGLTAPEITALLLPANDPSPHPPLNTVGARKVPDQSDLYIAIVCTGGDVPTRADDMPCNRFAGDASDTAPLHVRVGLIEHKPGSPPRLIAGGVSVDPGVEWRNTGLPSAPDALDDAKDGKISPQQYAGFDLAPYRIGKDQRAFGLRGTWSDSYSGGMGSYSALYLFAIVDGSLKQIIAVPISAYKDIAGDWHKDGTRSHDITQGANILIVSKHSTNGHFDLQLKSRIGHWQRLYQWSATASAYQPAIVRR